MRRFILNKLTFIPIIPVHTITYSIYTYSCVCARVVAARGCERVPPIALVKIAYWYILYTKSTYTQTFTTVVVTCTFCCNIYARRRSRINLYLAHLSTIQWRTKTVSICTYSVGRTILCEISIIP